ncbi:hypothetical protein RJ641_029864, partial [Dillenia turbinata]
MAFNNGLRVTASKLLSSSESLLTSKSVTRGFHSTGMKRMGGGHGHGHGHGHDEPYYVHAPHMYNLDRMKHQGLKVSLAVFTAFSIGVGVPIYARFRRKDLQGAMKKVSTGQNKRVSARSMARLAICGRPVLMQAAVNNHKSTAINREESKKKKA